MIRAGTAEDIDYFCRQVEYPPQTDIRTVVLLDVKGLVAVAAYDGWTENSVKMHIWIRDGGILSREFIREAFRYPFEVGNRGLVIGVTPGYNHAALEFNRRVGLKETYRIKDGWAAGTDLVIQEMRREQCRWLTKRVPNGEEEHSGGS